MRRRSGDGVPGRRKSSRSTSCSQGIDWVAEEHVEVQEASKRFKSEEENRTGNSSLIVDSKIQNACFIRQLTHPKGGKHGHKRKEDEILVQLVNLHSPRKWSTIACSMPGRSPYQCRDRWVFYLDPAVNKQPWSEQEEITLIHAHQIHGNKWTELAELFPGRTGKAIKNHWARLQNRKVKSHLVKGMSEQFPHRPIDSMIINNKGPSTNKRVQDSSTNIHVSSEMPVSPKLEQALTGAGRNPSTLNGKTSDITHGKRSVPHLVNVSRKVDGQITTSNLLLVTEESVDRKVPLAVASFPWSQQEEKLDFVSVRPNCVNTDFSPAHNLLSSRDHSDEICSSADSESQDPHLANLADLLDMSYCESLMIIPPDSPDVGDSIPCVECDMG